MQTVQYPLRWWFMATVAASVLLAPLAPLVRSWPADKLRVYLAVFVVELIVGGVTLAFSTWEWRKARHEAGRWLCRLTPPDRTALITAFLVAAMGVGVFAVLDRSAKGYTGQGFVDPAAPIALGVFLGLGALRAWMALMGDEVRSKGVVLGANWHAWREVERFEWLPGPVGPRETVRFYVQGVPFESSVPRVDHGAVDAILREHWEATRSGS